MLNNGPVFLAQRGTVTAVVVSTNQWNTIAKTLQRLEETEDLVDALRVEIERLSGKRPPLQMTKADVQDWLAEDASIPA
jgi:hypothetical protein